MKVHKKHDHKPSPRPLISQSGSITEHIGTSVEHFIHEEETKHQAFLQDTPDCLRIIDRINKGKKLHPNTLIATMDATGLITNIRHNDGLKSFEKILENRVNPKVPTDFLMKLMENYIKPKYT